MTESMRIQMLQKPQGPIDVVLDTDTYNEIDDQYALSYMMLRPDKMNVKAIYAAPFHNAKSNGPADGMERSYDEILKLLKFLGREDFIPNVYRGSLTYLEDENTPVESEAARALCKLAMQYTSEKPLYVMAIGAITNVASALLMQPEIAERMVVIWLGGHALEWARNDEFNLKQDIAAARIIFGCGVPVVQLPCMGVVENMRVTKPELEYWFRGKNALCDYLIDNTIEEADSYAKGTPWSRVIWDITPVIWLSDEEGKMMSERLEHSPVPEYDYRYSIDRGRHFIKYVWHIDRDRIMEELVKVLSSAK